MKVCVCYAYDGHTHAFLYSLTNRMANVYLHAHPRAAVGDMAVAGVAILE